MMGLSNIRMKNEEAHIDTVRDDEYVDNGDMNDDEDEDDDQDEVIEIKTPSRPSSSSSLDDAADAALRPSTEIHISDKFIQERLGQKRPVQSPHDETEASRLNLALARAWARAQRHLADRATRDHHGSAVQSAQHAC